MDGWMDGFGWGLELGFVTESSDRFCAGKGLGLGDTGEGYEGMTILSGIPGSHAPRVRARVRVRTKVPARAWAPGGLFTKSVSNMVMQDSSRDTIHIQS